MLKAMKEIWRGLLILFGFIVACFLILFIMGALKAMGVKSLQ